MADAKTEKKKVKEILDKLEEGLKELFESEKYKNKLAPVTGEVMLDKDGTPQTEEVEIKITAFRAVSVFDVSQTDGEPIPELEAKEFLSTVEGYEGCQFLSVFVILV